MSLRRRDHKAMLARRKAWDREDRQLAWQPLYPNFKPTSGLPLTPPNRHDTRSARVTLEPMASPTPGKVKTTFASITHELFIVLTFITTVLGGNVALDLAKVLPANDMTIINSVSAVAAGLLSALFVNGQFQLKTSEVATGLTWVKAHEALIEKDAEELAGPASAAKLDSIIQEVERIGTIAEVLADSFATHAADVAPVVGTVVVGPSPGHRIESGPIAPQPEPAPAAEASDPARYSGPR